MHYLLQAQEMRNLDAYTINQIGVPSIVLMERAALCVFEEMKPYLTQHSNVLVLCGTGNNGGDGLALARMLSLKHFKVQVYIVGDMEKGSTDFLKEYAIIEALGIKTITKTECFENCKMGRYDLAADALFGTGLSRPLSEEFEEVIRTINDSEAMVFAVDIPSGISADCGSVSDSCIQADITVTFGQMKLGHLLYPGSSYCGKVIIKDIGLVSLSAAGIRPSCYTYDQQDLSRLPLRPADSHKGTFGRLAVIAGSVDMGGAAVLAAKAAYRMGAGVVKVVTPEVNRTLILSAVPEAIVFPYDVDGFSIDFLSQVIKWADAIVIGPGLGRAAYVKTMINYLFQYAKCPMILDADALNTIADYPEMKTAYPENIVLTPHIGEMGRLTGKSTQDIQKNLMETAISYSEGFQAICVLKSARTMVAAPGSSLYINATGNSGMATAGSGDVLTGVIGALLACGLHPKYAATLGVFLHGWAGDLMAERIGEYSLTASDLIEGLPLVLRQKNTNSDEGGLT